MKTRLLLPTLGAAALAAGCVATTAPMHQHPYGQPSDRPHQTIDTRTQRLPAAPAGHEWRRSESGDHILVQSSTGVIVQVVRDVTPR